MPHHDGAVPTRECPACNETVPTAVFCGSCGADLAAPVDRWSVLLRPRVYVNAHREPIWVPRFASTLFPRIPGKARKPFQLALFAVAVAVVVLAAAKAQGPLIVMAVIGWPLLFVIYVWQSDVFRDVPRRLLVMPMVLGAALGIGSWLAISRVVAGSYGVSTGLSFLLISGVLNVGFLISLSGGVLMLVPAVVVRLSGVPTRESLDGFVLGAFGALWYSTTASATVLAPQFTEGLTERQTVGRLLEDAITYGIANAICTTAAGGVFGLSLWFRAAHRDGRDPRRARLALTICTILAVGTYVGIWGIDSLDLPRAVDVAATIVVSVLALIIVRISVQIAVLHEAPDPGTGDPLLCVHCERVVPDMAFCAACGAAARASSRSSRRLRRESPPVYRTAS